MQIGTWNVRTMYEAGKTAQVAAEMRHYNIVVLGLCETRWTLVGQLRLSTGELLMYSGHPEDNAPHSKGVGMTLNPASARSLMEWNMVSSRIITARFFAKPCKIFIMQCYAPTNDADEQEKEEFYQQLQEIVNQKKKKDILILMGDLNAKIGSDNDGREMCMGKEGLGEMMRMKNYSVTFVVLMDWS